MAKENYLKLEMRTEDKLLLQCTRIQISPVEKVRKLLQDDLNWDYLIQKAINHRLIPLLYWNLKNFPHDVPLNILNDLKEHYDHNALKNLLILGELIKLLRLFEKEELRVIPYKGPVLAIKTYENLGLRDFSDIDILVAQKDISLMKKTISPLNYEPELKYNPGIEEKFFKYQKEYKFINKKQNIALDIHLRFSSLFLPHSDSWNFFNEEILHEMDLSPVSTWTLPPENMFLILCLHNYSHQWTYLSLLVDLAEFINKHDINWTQVERMGREMGIRKIVLLNLNLLKELVDFPTGEIPLNLSKNKIPELTIEIIDKRFLKGEIPENSLLNLFKNNIRFRDNLFLGLMDCAKDAFVPTNFELEKVELPSWLFFLYFIIRPFLLLSRYKL